MKIFKNLFHKMKTTFIRLTNTSIPYIDDIKQFGNEAEDEFINTLINSLPHYEIKRNIIINTPDGNAEIDLLILYENKLFSIEFKSWKGNLIEQENGFIQKKNDVWTNEVHTKVLKSPFKQLQRAIYLLKSSNTVQSWITPIVYFDNTELESLSIKSNNIWFANYNDIIDFIINNDIRPSKNTKNFFDNCVSGDHIYRYLGDKSLSCIINPYTLCFQTNEYIIHKKEIRSIRIKHHFSYDELYIFLIDQSLKVIEVENGSIEANVNGTKYLYYFSKIDYIELGNTIKK